jgi:hypothetical protein
VTVKSFCTRIKKTQLIQVFKNKNKKETCLREVDFRSFSSKFAVIGRKKKVCEKKGL